MTREKKEITIRGVIVGQDWDADSCPTEVSIQTAAGREVFVDQVDAGEELLDLEGAEVELIGLLDESDPDYPSIAVRDYEILHDPYDDDDEEEDEADEDEDEEDGDWGDDDWDDEDEDEEDEDEDEEGEEEEDEDEWEEDDDWAEDDEEDEEDERSGA